MIYWSTIVESGRDFVNGFYQKVFYRNKTANTLIVYPFGYHANANNDSLVLTFGTNGQAENRAGIPFDTKNRPILKQGEIALYQPATEITTIIKFDESGNILIDTAGDLTATVGGNMTATVSGNLVESVAGDITTDADVISIEAAGQMTLTAADMELDSDVTVTGAFGTNGASAQGSAALGAAATDLGTVIALANTTRLALIANGIGS